jgi:hypothetical protein
MSSKKENCLARISQGLKQRTDIKRAYALEQGE